MKRKGLCKRTEKNVEHESDGEYELQLVLLVLSLKDISNDK